MGDRRVDTDGHRLHPAVADIELTPERLGYDIQIGASVAAAQRARATVQATRADEWPTQPTRRLQPVIARRWIAQYADAMGYELHITRAEFHFKNEGHWITAEEWLAYVAQDPELKLAENYGHYCALWSGKSEYPDPWLEWYEGNIYTKNPDDALIDKMVQIAKKLNAKVQGDDGEIYTGGGPGQVLPPPASKPESPLARPRQSWLRRLFGG